MHEDNAQCECGEIRYAITGAPLLRAYCHCTICQALNNAPYADITLYRAKDVVMPESRHLEYNAEKFPPVLQRGTCTACQRIAIEYLQLFPIPKTIIVPSHNINDGVDIPDPMLHIFYDSRVKDMDDGLPKYQGYIHSQLAFSQQLLKAMWALR